MSNYSATSTEVLAITDYISSMFGAPTVTVELSANHYTRAFNVANEEYSNFINQWAIKTNIANALGLPSSTDFTLRWISKNFEFLNSFTQAYSEQAGVGGKLPIRKSYFTLVQNKQIYYLPDNITVNEVMWQDTPAILKYLTDPYNDAHWTTTEFGWAYMGNSFMYVTPIYYGIQMAQMSEIRDRVRKSELEYRVLPAPEDGSRTGEDYTGRTKNAVYLYPAVTSSQAGSRVWYFYWNDSDLNTYSGQTAGQYVSNPGTMKIDEIPYSAFNSTGQRWVSRYSLAVAKEILGRIRNKFGEIPIPDATITLDGPTLLAEAKSEQEELKKQLLDDLEQMSSLKILEDDTAKAENVNKQLTYNPLGLYLL